MRVLDGLTFLHDLLLALGWVFLAHHLLQKMAQGLADVHLYEAELLVALILQDLREERDLVIVPDIALDTRDDRASPLDDERLEAILLIKVVVHELLHGLDRELGLVALPVVLELLRVDVANDVLQLFQWQHLGMGLVAEAIRTSVACGTLILSALHDGLGE